MSKERQTRTDSSLDTAVSQKLAKKYGDLSRRSFFSLATRQLIGVAGVTVASEFLPFMTNTAYAQTTCALHGYVCDTTTSCRGGTAGSHWMQCCEIGCNIWQCCTYTDYCGTRLGTWPAGCTGTIPSGTSWCGSAPGAYICTTVGCTGTTYSTYASCDQACSHTCMY
jgi:hypothetical protein